MIKLNLLYGNITEENLLKKFKRNIKEGEIYLNENKFHFFMCYLTFDLHVYQ